VIRRWAGPLITALILGGIALILLLNLNLDGKTGASGSDPAPIPPVPVGQDNAKPLGFREYSIPPPQFQSGMKIAAVWLPPIQMDGMTGLMDSDVIHLEADIHATEANPNGFALDEFVPYLKIHYTITPADAEKPLHEGELIPMIASDGLHYGASIAMPKAGRYRLTYEIQPPSAGGLGRHSDRVTGVAPWWKPFRVSWDWNYPGPPTAEAPTENRR
jgi:uncharacterized protein involved in high-affinity Fe2+ transport